MDSRRTAREVVLKVTQESPKLGAQIPLPCTCTIGQLPHLIYLDAVLRHLVDPRQFLFGNLVCSYPRLSLSAPVPVHAVFSQPSPAKYPASSTLFWAGT